MRIGPTEILDTHAEAFHAWYARLIISAADEYWLRAALTAITGYGTSVIGCDAEVGVERNGAACQSPDGRLAAAVLLFAFTSKSLEQAIANRVGQCVLTCPTTACFNGLPSASSEKSVRLGDHIRFFGDGFESQTFMHGRDMWRIPVMDGEFFVEQQAGITRGVAGGNLIIQAATDQLGLAAARRAAGATAECESVILPFPAGVCRSGSKVGSIYKKLKASTNAAYCPTLRDQLESQLMQGAKVAYEIVIDGVDETSVRSAMRAAISAAAGEGVIAIGAGNYGGRLGKIQIPLHELA
jgi:formylmethanofuran--tetrahydromethanopterin N-formyltransferase